MVRILWLLVAWTSIVWVGRIRNVFSETDISGEERVWRLVVAAIFLILAALVSTVAIGRWHRRPLGSSRLVAVFCLWTIGFWVVRGGGLLFGDHDAGFKIVHTILALISIGLAGVLYWLDRSVKTSAGGTRFWSDQAGTVQR